jgi:hypothetical protein
MAFNYTYRAEDYVNTGAAQNEQHEDDDDAQTDTQNSRSVSRQGEGESGFGLDDMTLPPPTSVNSVRAQMYDVRFANYLQEFDAEAEGETVIVCSLPAVNVDDGARAQLLAAGIEKEDDAMRHTNEVGHITTLKRNRLLELEQVRQNRRANQMQTLRDVQLMKQHTNELVATYYAHANRELNIHLTSRQAEVSQSIGEIRKFTRGDYDPDKPDWTQFEQQVQIDVVKVRGVKNKVPKGKFTVVVSKWEKLGGDPLRWSSRTATDKPPPPCPLHADVKEMAIKKRCEVCRGWAGATMVAEHDAKPTSFDLKFNSKLHTFFLPQTRIKPYNTLVFELIHIPDTGEGQRSKGSQVAVRPQVVGWGVIPIVDSRFEVINGKFRFPMLRGPYRPDFGKFETVQKAIVEDLENWLGNLYVDIFPHPREHFGRNEFQLQTDYSNRVLNLAHYPSAKDSEGWPFDARKRGASIDAGKTGKANVLAGTFGEDFNFEEEEFPYARPARWEEWDTPALTHWNLVRVAIMDRSKQKRIVEQEAQREAIKRLELMKRFRYSIHPYGATNLQSVWRIQVEYCVRAIFDELSLRHPLSVKFWLNVFVFLVSLYFQLYVHGVFTYIALYAMGIPIFDITPTWYGILISYSHQNTYPLQELFVVFFSQMSTYFVLLSEIGIGWLFNFATGTIPDNLSKFVFTAALSACLVPWIEVALDLMMGTARSDWFRLQIFFADHGYGAYYTWIIFLIIYTSFFAGSVVSTFLYTMGLHFNGILQDAYWRIMVVNEDTCHIPDDLELSTEELRHILSSAERWRGKNGERRKITVHRLTTTDEADVEFKREDLHIVVHELKCANFEQWEQMRDSQPYREFYVMEDGAILETLQDSHVHGVAFALNKMLGKGGDGDDQGAAAKALGAIFGGGGGGGGRKGGGKFDSSAFGTSKGFFDQSQGMSQGM